MANTPTEAQIRRAVKGAIDGGFAVGAVEIDSNGTIRLLPTPKIDAKQVDTKTKPKAW